MLSGVRESGMLGQIRSNLGRNGSTWRIEDPLPPTTGLLSTVCTPYSALCGSNMPVGITYMSATWPDGILDEIGLSNAT